ncbi:MAG: hypothetical protein R2939_22885 [Kofleriaceae bacterium]
MRRRQLVGARQVEPDLEQLDRVVALPLEQREHLAVDDAGAGGEPLGVALAEAGGGAERVAVIDEAAPHQRHRLEAAVRVLRKPGHHLAVVHAPAVLAGEVLAEVTTGQRRRRPHRVVADRISVVVVNAEQERVDGRPLEAQRRGLADDVVGHGDA